MTLDRRKEIRYSVDGPAVLKIKNEKMWDNHDVRIMDLNMEGAKISTTNVFAPGRNMNLEIFVNSELNTPVHLPVRIHQYSRNSEMDCCVFQFKTLNDEQKQQLRSYLKLNNAVIKKDRRYQQRRSKSVTIDTEKRNSDRRLKYPIFLKCARLSQFRNLVQDDAYFFLREVSSSCHNNIIVHGEKLINFGSNNYLGLATHPAVVEAGIKAAEKYGIGSGGVRMLSGTMDIHNQLEKKIAEFKGGEDCVIYSTGYTTNIAVVSLIADKNDSLVIDEKSHASIIDGCTLSGAQIVAFKHNSIKDLENKLQRIDKEGKKLIITDGVFSMDGDICKLDEIYSVAEKYNTPVMIDDAHATGVIGENGKGTASHFGLDGKISVIVGTLSKALGGIGGFVVSNKSVIHALKHFSRGFVFTTSLPPLISASVLKAIEVMEAEPQLYNKLSKNIEYLKSELIARGFDIGNTESAIIPIMIRDRRLTYQFVKILQNSGIFVNGIEYPAVRKRESRLRVSVMATHTENDLSYFIDSVAKIGRSLKVI